MPRNWRCANGHTWAGEIGALTFCPVCNSQDVYEVRQPGVTLETPLPVNGADLAFAQPRRAPRGLASAPPRIQPSMEATAIQPPLTAPAATETTATQIPSLAPSASEPPLDAGLISTQELYVGPSNQTTVIMPTPPPPPEAPQVGNATLVCQVISDGTGNPICVPASESLAYVPSSTSDSTAELPKTAQMIVPPTEAKPRRPEPPPRGPRKKVAHKPPPARSLLSRLRRWFGKTDS